MQSSKVRLMLGCAGLVIAVALAAFSSALAEGFTPVFKPTMTVSKATGSIKIDGKLDDAGWKSVVPTGQFVERSPGDNTQPEVQTRLFVTYDDAKLYVAFDCQDDPATIRATMSQRDQYEGNDMVCVLLDPYGTGIWAYEFFVNPYGIQRDLLWNNLGRTDVGFDAIWESAAQRTGSGYAVEIAIPFTSIRFPDKDVQSWRMDFWRNRPREVLKQYSWTAYDRAEQCFVCQWGTVDGIKDVHPGKGFGLMPAMVAHQNGLLTNENDPRSSFSNEDPKGELSVGAKYALSSDITAEAAINPDFSQIESDAAQIDVNSTVSLFYPERRPFFQEGSDIFLTLFNSFYTRMVNDPQVAAKLTGRHGRSRIGFLSAYDENSPYIVPLNASDQQVAVGKSTVNVLRAAQQFGRDNFVGVMLGDRRFDGGGSNTILSADGQLRFSRTYSAVYQYVMTHTTEPTRPDLDLLVDDSLSAYGDTSHFDVGKHTNFLDGESYWGDAFITQVRRGTRHWYSYIGYNQIAPSYRTQIGYDPVANHRTAEAYTQVSILPKHGLIQNINPQVYVSRRWDFKNGVCRYNYINGSLDVYTNFAQSHVGFNYNYNYERYEGVPFGDLYGIGINADTRISDQVGVAAYVSRGKGLRRYFGFGRKANSTSYGASMTIKPVDRLTIEPNLDYQRMCRPSDGRRYFSGYITRTKAQYQATKALSVRLIVQYNDFYKQWDVDPLITYRLNPFSVLYVGSSVGIREIYPYPDDPDNPSQWRTASRQFFLKLQYLFQT